MDQVSRAIRFAANVAALAILAGCAMGQKISYQNTVADVEASGDKSISVATHDQRPYVVSGDKEASFVGLSRGGYGNPFDILTTSGAPLSDEFSESISRSLAERGFKSAVIKISAAESRRSTMEKLLASGAERLVLINVKEWKSDKYVRTALTYDVTVKVFDMKGSELAAQSFHGDEKIGDVLLAFRSKIEEWFSEPKIVAALK